MTNINQSKQYADALNQEIKREAKSAVDSSTAQWRKPAAVFELKATFFNSGMGSIYKAPVVFNTVSQWKTKDDVSYMVCSASTVILATSSMALQNFLAENGDSLGICGHSTAHEKSVVPICVLGGTFRASIDYMKCGAYVNWIAEATKALASNSMALGAPTNMLQDVASFGRAAIPLAIDARSGKSNGGKVSDKANTELLAQRLRDNQPEGHTLSGCAIAMGISFSHFEGRPIGNHEYYTFAELNDNDVVVDAIHAAHSQLLHELRGL